VFKKRTHLRAAVSLDAEYFFVGLRLRAQNQTPIPTLGLIV